MKPIDYLDRIADCIAKWAKDDRRVRAMFWFGSYCTRDISSYSDLDCALVLRPDVDINTLLADIRVVFGSECVFDVGRGYDGKACFWLSEQLVKVDIYLARLPDDLVWLADAKDVPAPRMTQVFDRDSLCNQLLDRAMQPAVMDVNSRINQEVEKFLIAFEACSLAQHSNDAYGHYFEYNLALGRLARLIQLARGKPYKMYLPTKLTTSCLTHEEQMAFCDLAGTMQLGKPHDTTRRLAAYFLNIQRELASRYQLSRTVGEVQIIINKILLRYT
ncbi:MAG: hypothetical protein HC898_05400 [Phycisphaerales bacterium]|nr:hypothetical protein [Phycisphaerales bacterium]